VVFGLCIGYDLFIDIGKSHRSGVDLGSLTEYGYAPHEFIFISKQPEISIEFGVFCFLGVGDQVATKQ